MDEILVPFTDEKMWNIHQEMAIDKKKHKVQFIDVGQLKSLQTS